MATMSPLRRRMIDDMMVRNLSPATQQSYIYAVRLIFDSWRGLAVRKLLILLVRGADISNM